VTVILLRHGRSTSNTAHVLAGRSEGVDLDDKGRQQAAELVDRIGELPIRAVVCSPLLRCRRTIEPLADALGIEPVLDDRFSEVDYGEWTGRKLADLVKEPLWGVVQAHPSAAVFPGGEGLAQVQARAVAAVLLGQPGVRAARRRRAVAGLYARRRHQGGRRRRAWPTPGRLPTCLRRSGIDECDPLHPTSPVRTARESHRPAADIGADGCSITGR
jgi:probable phosphomutase (TIGR03848 family)